MSKSGAKLWKPCDRHQPHADQKTNGKNCKICDLSEPDHRGLSLPVAWPETQESAREGAGMSLPEWRAADVWLKAEAVVNHHIKGYRSAYNRQIAVMARNGVVVQDDGLDASAIAWSQRRGKD